MINKIGEYNTTVLFSTNPPVINRVDENFSEILDTKLSSNNYSEVSCPNDLENIFEQASNTYDISINLLKAVAKAESDFNPDCTSSAGAMGIMQLMPETAKGLGVTNAYDPEQNIMGGAKYLAENLDIFNGDVSLAVAAYNAGRGAVSKYDGIPPYTETQNYVKKVLSFLNEDITIPENVTYTNSTSNNVEEKGTNTDYTYVNKKAFEKLSSASSTTIINSLYQ